MGNERKIFALIAGVLVAGLLFMVTRADPDKRPELSEAPAPTTTVATVPSTAPPTTEAPDPWLATVAQAVETGEFAVFAAPGDAEPDRFLSHPTPVGADLVLLVKEDLGDWLEVHLPVRPNGTTGFIPKESVKLVTHRYHIEVRLAEFNLKVFEGDEVLLDTEIGVARDNAPTPGGLYFITELLAPPTLGGPYGPYAYGLSGFSETFDTFNGGDGQLGIHGTNDPDAIGTKVSSGCIRLRNEDITYIVESIGLPLGVPVSIVA